MKNKTTKGMKKRSIIILLLAGSMISPLLTSCRDSQNNAAAEDQPAREDVLAWVEVEERSVREELLLSGDIVADERAVARVVAPVGGKVSAVRVEVGEAVKRGVHLAVVSSPEAADHQRELQEAESECRLARHNLTMKEQLLADGMASEREAAEARERLLVAEAAKARSQAAARINSLSGQATATLTAPISGTVLQKHVYNNQYVSAGDELFLLADLSRVWALADVYEMDISRISEGTPVEVTTIAWPNEVFHGSIDRNYGSLDMESKTMKVRVNLPNADGRLRPGMFASVRVLLGGSGRRLPCVPAKAVVFENGHHYVVTGNGSDIRRQEIAIALETDSLVYVSEGVSPGQKVVAQNALLIYNSINSSANE